ncbi:MAG: type III secretion system inner rod subunit SctI [Thermodesulforhabdaceae bacterium]
MIESVQTKKIVEQGIEEAGKGASSEKLSTPKEGDVEKFESALSQGVSGENHVETTKIPSQQPEAISPGDKILRSLDAQRESFEGYVKEIDQALGRATEDKNVSPAELLGLQWKLQQASLELEVTTKVVEKGNEGVSTLLKNQG